jgi:restriction system protein
MAIWLFRAGKSGQYETKFLNEKKIFLTWDELNKDLSKFEDKRELFDFLVDFYDNHKRNTIRNWTGQIWPIAKELKVGDWVVLPSKLKAAVHIGEITGDYKFDSKAENPFYHYRTVKWFATDIPRSNFEQDILYSFGAFMTVCRIHRNNAEERIKLMAENSWQPVNLNKLDKKERISGDTEEISETESDLEQLANDQIAKFLIRKYKRHGMAQIIEAILKAKGYTTYCSPEGADKGVDILAAPEPMGFGKPRLCVQVKTGDTPIDRPTLDQLIGAMQNFHAEQGLLVSWSGFKSTVDREIPNQFFRVRLWGQKEIIQELLLNYEKLDEDIRADLPLKKIWTLSFSDEE